MRPSRCKPTAREDERGRQRARILKPWPIDDGTYYRILRRVDSRLLWTNVMPPHPAHGWLHALAWVCLGLSCLPSYSSDKHGDSEEIRISVGLHFAPLCSYVHQHVERVVDGHVQLVSFNQNWTVHWVSWSMLLFVFGMVIFPISRHLRRASAPAVEPAEKHLKSSSAE